MSFFANLEKLTSRAHANSVPTHRGFVLLCRNSVGDLSSAVEVVRRFVFVSSTSPFKILMLRAIFLRRRVKVILRHFRKVIARRDAVMLSIVIIWSRWEEENNIFLQDVPPQQQQQQASSSSPLSDAPSSPRPNFLSPRKHYAIKPNYSSIFKASPRRDSCSSHASVFKSVGNQKEISPLFKRKKSDGASRFTPQIGKMFIWEVNKANSFVPVFLKVYVALALYRHSKKIFLLASRKERAEAKDGNEFPKWQTAAFSLCQIDTDPDSVGRWATFLTNSNDLCFFAEHRAIFRRLSCLLKQISRCAHLENEIMHNSANRYVSPVHRHENGNMVVTFENVNAFSASASPPSIPCSNLFEEFNKRLLFFLKPKMSSPSSSLHCLPSSSSSSPQHKPTTTSSSSPQHCSPQLKNESGNTFRKSFPSVRVVSSLSSLRRIPLSSPKASKSFSPISSRKQQQHGSSSISFSPSLVPDSKKTKEEEEEQQEEEGGEQRRRSSFDRCFPVAETGSPTKKQLLDLSFDSPRRVLSLPQSTSIASSNQQPILLLSSLLSASLPKSPSSTSPKFFEKSKTVWDRRLSMRTGKPSSNLSALPTRYIPTLPIEIALKKSDSSSSSSQLFFSPVNSPRRNLSNSVSALFESEENFAALSGKQPSFSSPKQLSPLCKLNHKHVNRCNISLLQTSGDFLG